MAARNFRGTIRQESIAPSAPGGRTSARRMWSRDRREEFNSRPSIADTVDYNLKARSSGLRHDTRLADCGPAPVTAQTPCGRRLFDLHLRKSTLPRGEPCPGWLQSLRLRWSNAAFLPVEIEDSPKPAMHRSGTQAVNRHGVAGG